MSTFMRLGDRLVPTARITCIDARRLERYGSVEVHVDGELTPVRLSGPDAVELVMRLFPCFFEGRRFRWGRWMWAVHNLVGHPLLQVLAWVGQTKLGLAIHDATIPRPGA